MRCNFFTTVLIFFLASKLSLADYDPALGLDYIYASALSHCDPVDIMAWNCGKTCQYFTGYQPFFSEVITVTTNETLSFSMIYSTSAKKFITTYRGTVGDYELELEYEFGNGIPFALYDVPNALVQNYFYTRYVNNIRPVLTQQLQLAITSFPDYQFIFTGHSLGAALTTLTAFDVVKSELLPVSQVALYNYGSPRVANYELAQAIEAAIPEIYRVVHWKDYVPHVPACRQDSTGQCVEQAVEDSSALFLSGKEDPATWPAWHIGSEVFYTEDSSSYKVCQGEDPTCADQFSLTQITWADHGVYLTIPVSC